MGTNYNPSQEPWSDKQTMLQAALSCTGKASDDQLHGVECDPSKLSGTPGKYVRSNPTTDDLKDYDLGLFQIAVSGIPTAYQNQPIGQLWVSYTVELRKPKRFSNDGLGISRDVFCASSLSPLGVTTTLGDPLGLNLAQPAVLAGVNNSIGCDISQPSTGTTQTTFPDGFTGILKVRLWVQSSNPAVPGVYVATIGGAVAFVTDTVNGATYNWIQVVHLPLVVEVVVVAQFG